VGPTIMKFLLLCLSVLLLIPLDAAWRELDGTRYVVKEANDADSFHAKRNSSRYILRLYFVDAPETENRFPERVKEQAEYFGCEAEALLKEAQRAAEAVEAKLKDQTLTVHTQYRDARGGSDRKRYYAMVEVEGRWLSEWLVEQGWARLHGLGTELPDGVSERRYWSRLKTLENQAKQAKRGCWGLSQKAEGSVADSEKQDQRLAVATAVYQREAPYRFLGQLPAGYPVHVEQASDRPGYRCISFVSPGGHAVKGEVLASQLRNP